MPLANFTVYSFDVLASNWFSQHSSADKANALARAVKMSYEHVGVLFKVSDDNHRFDDGFRNNSIGVFLNGHELNTAAATDYMTFLKKELNAGEIKAFTAEQLTSRAAWIPADFLMSNKATARFYCCNRHSKNLFRVTPPAGEPLNGLPFYYFGGREIDEIKANQIISARVNRRAAMESWVVSPFQPTKPGLRYLERAVKQRGIGGISNALRAVAAEIEAIIRAGNLTDAEKIALAKAAAHLLDASEIAKGNE